MKISRIGIDEYYIRMAWHVSLRSTCARRQVGAVAVDKNDYLISTGYNGVPANRAHCIDIPCEGADLESGIGLDKCMAIHAEVNCIAHCKNPQDIHTIYSTTSPCIHCIKLLAATKCQEIVFDEEYPHKESKDYWLSIGRIWRQFPWRAKI